MVVAGVTATLWRRSIASALSISERAVRSLTVGFVFVAAGLSALLYWLVSEILAQAGGGAFSGDSRALLRLVFAGLFIGALVFLLVLCTSAPERTALETVLTLTPISARSRVIGPFLPFVAVGSISALLLGVPSLSLIFRLDAREAFPLIAIAGFIWLLLWSSVTFTALFFVVRALLARLVSLPPGYGIAIAATVCAIVGFALSGGDLIPVRIASDHAWWQSLSPTRALADAIVEGLAGAQSVTLAVWTVVTITLVWVLGRVREPASTRASSRALLWLVVPRSRWGARLWLELVLVARLPQFVVALLVAMAGAIAFPLLFLQPVASATISELAALVVVIPCAIGLYSFGVSRSTHWVGALTTGRRAGWVLPKALSVVAASIALVAPYLVIMALVGLPMDRVLDIASLGAAVLACSLVIGHVLPCEPGRSLSAAASSTALAVTWAVVVIAPRWLAGQLSVGPPWLVTMVTAVCILLVYLRLAVWSTKHRDAIA